MIFKEPKFQVEPVESSFGAVRYVDRYWRVETAKDFTARYGISDRRDGNMCFDQNQGTGVVENRKHFFDRAHLSPERTVMPDVVHGSEVAVITEDDLGRGVLDLRQALRVDGVISYLPDSALAVDTGDCPVIIFSSQDGKMIGLAHAGWKSLEGGIIDEMLAKIKEKTSAEKISVIIGVGICSDCYRFPSNAKHPLLTNPNWKNYKTEHKDGTVSFDLNAYIKEHLKQAGVDVKNINAAEHTCSCHSKDASGQNIFYSHRRASRKSAADAKAEGRFITFVSR